MRLTERRKCAEPRCDRQFIPKSSRHRYCHEHRRTKPRDPVHDVRHDPARRRFTQVRRHRPVPGLIGGFRSAAMHRY